MTLAELTAERFHEARREVVRWRTQAYRQRQRAEFWKERAQSQAPLIRRLRADLYREQVRNLLGPRP